jgi:hypothetical protein
MDVDSIIKPVYVAEKLCVAHGYDFDEKLGEYLREGWVYSGEDCFVMAKISTLDKIIGQNSNKDIDKSCWFIFVYAGKLKRVLELIPSQQKYVVFRRYDGADKVYNMKQLITKVEKVL